MENSIAIKLKLERIYQEAMEYPGNLSLYNGKTGNCLFGILYSKHFKNDQIDAKLANNMQAIIDGYFTVHSDSLSNGRTGVNWFFSLIYKWDLIDSEDLEEICFADNDFPDIAIKMLNGGNYDFLHGSLGIAYYLLEKKADPIFFGRFFHELNLLFSKRKDGMISSFDFMNDIVETNQVNISLSHGIVGILKFCVQCYSNNMCKGESYQLALKIIAYLRENQNLNKEISYFSSFIIDDKAKKEISRMAWCYGDLTIAYVLYQSSVAFEDNELETYAMEIFEHSMKRRSYESTFVRDGGICHGTAGIAHVYNRMWHHTRKRPFREACEFWIDQTLKLDEYGDTISGYKRYCPPTGHFEPSNALLEGSTGIGLVLLSYLTDDFSWDYSIMLN